jgi:parallel beta-helix repeat protein
MIARAYDSAVRFLSFEFQFLLPALLAAAVATVLAVVPARPAMAITYYVATDGSDSNSGTSTSAPFRTIQRAMNVVAPGDNVQIRGGTYREQIESTRGGTAAAPVTVAAYPGEAPVIKGSVVVTGWVLDSGTVWKKTGWTANSQQVFVDFDASPKKSLQQIGMPSQYYTSWEYPAPVGTGRASMAPGTFYYDAAATTLYVQLADGSDPNQHVMEASVLRRLFMMHQPYLRIKGLRFRHSSTSAFAQQGAAVELSSNSVIEDCDIQYVDFTGLGMGYLQDGAHAHNCVVSNNGDSGITTAGSTNFWVSNATLQYNNSRNFNTLWHAGGFKGATQTFGVIESSDIGFNNGSGVWFDYANGNSPIIVRNNYIHDNGPSEAAVFFEVSNNGLIYNNVIANNSRRGVYLSAANNSRVYNNTIYGTTSRAGIEVAGMPRGTATLTNNVAFNNIISHGTSLYDLYIMPGNGTTITGNSSDYNNFYRPSGALALRYVDTYQTLAAWRSGTQMDAHSLSVNPAFISAGASASGYAVSTGSSIIDAGTNLLSAVPNDYLGAFRPSGTSTDMGAFEYTQAPLQTADIAPPVVAIGGATVSKNNVLTITASAKDNVGVTGMALYIGGVLKASSATGQISYTWGNPNGGSYEIRVTASDAAKNTGSATATLNVQGKREKVSGR